MELAVPVFMDYAPAFEETSAFNPCALAKEPYGRRKGRGGAHHQHSSTPDANTV